MILAEPPCIMHTCKRFCSRDLQDKTGVNCTRTAKRRLCRAAQAIVEAI